MDRAPPSVSRPEGETSSAVRLARRRAGHDRHRLRHRVRLRGDDRHASAEPHDLDAVGELEDVRHVVADQDHRQAALADPPDQVEHLARLLDAERSGRLVHDHQPLRPGGGPGDGDPWRCPPERFSTGWVIDWTPIWSSAKCRVASRRIARLSSMRSTEPERASPPQLPAEEDVRGDVERGGDGEVLVDGLDPGSPRVARERKCTRSPSRRISPSSGCSAPESALISVDLPAPLSPMIARISPGRARSRHRSSATTCP